MGFVVALDGPAGSGKGTVTKEVAKKMDLINIDTGAMYRCVTLYMIRNKIELEDSKKIEELLNTINIELKKENNEEKVYLNKEDVSFEIRTNEVNKLVSQVSHIVQVRENITELSRKIAEGKRIIMEGRDIGTNVFPNADVKIYLDATPEERARRRFKQNEENGIKIPFDEILKNVKERDYIDSHREIAPLKKADEAIYIDSTGMTIEEEANEVIKIIEEKRR